MARNENSTVNFNLNVKGLQDAEKLKKVLPQLIDMYEKLTQLHQKYTGMAGGTGSGGGGTGSGSSGAATTAADVSNRLSGIELGVRKGDIDSVQRLTANYASLVNQINAVGKAGNKTNSIRLRSLKTYERLRQSIEEKAQAQRAELQAQAQSAVSTDRMRTSLLDQVGSIELSTNTLKQAGQQMGQTAQATTNASYLLLNAGYLIQDSPYGIRGMANNVSQLTQAYQMLSLRVNELNAMHGTSLSVFGQLKTLLTGSTGIILLIGSVLPAALELVSQNWDKWFGSVEESSQAFEDQISLIEEYIGWSDELRKSFGEDPLGVLSTQSEIDQLTDLRDELQEVSNATEEYENQLEDISRGFGAGRLFEEFQAREELPELLEEAESLEDSMGELADVPLEKLKDKIDDMNVSLALSRRLVSDDPAAIVQQSYGSVVDSLISQFEILEEAGRDEMAQNAESQVNTLVEFFRFNMNEAIDSGDFGLAESWRRLIEQSDISEESEDELDLEDVDLDISEGTEEMFESMREMESQFASDMNALRESRADRELEGATNRSDRLEALNESHYSRISEIRRQNHDNEFESQSAFNLAMEKEMQDYYGRRRQIIQESVMQELQLQEILLSEGIDTSFGYEEKLNNIGEYYDTRRKMVKESVDDELEQKRRLKELDIEEAREREDVEQNVSDTKKEIRENFTSFAIDSITALAQFGEENSRAQFQIQKYSSAARATMNTYEAITAALATPGLPPGVRTAYAISVGAFGFARVSKILSQSYRGGGSGESGSGGNLSYRGFSATGSGESGMTEYSPYRGTQQQQNRDMVDAQNSGGEGDSEREVRDIRILNGFDNVVMEGEEMIEKRGGRNYLKRSLNE